MIVAKLTNFGTTIYTGSDLNEAIEKVQAAGFEATIQFDSVLLCYSPIGGWKNFSLR